ncbi:hypothetical protein BZA05DRAFT_398587 [Tricharina praecox]|uniref:uncharacterized protein n=1 Tax=Tricharina praecox TaxID=43433 RepID=UPI002220C70C|nr:uncharacterized protein BZA05DRAFT_398587 [Tricharina praecox]KAI5851990.1 hypothetical protein BZA05DRAFT_398587 [Tricharina praecox]
MAMNSLISWALFISVVGAIWFVQQRGKTPQAQKIAKKVAEVLPEKVKAVPEKAKAKVASSGGGGVESAGEVKKKAKKKVKKSSSSAAASLSNSVVKEKKVEVKSDDDDDDDDVAEEVDLKDVARRLKLGGAGRYAGSQTSSTGADGDIDEEYSKSNDPSDMLEPSTSGPGVLRIGAPVQPPRTQKKKSAPVNDSGVHAAKNAKKKEKEKAARAQERAEQHARLEQHRKAQRVAEAARPAVSSPAPVSAAAAAASSAWTQVGSKKPPRATTPVPAATSTASSSSALLDTFTPGDSDSEPIQRSTTLGDSWESIPPNAMVPEPEWNEVKSKKSTRSMRKSDDSADETITLPKAKTPTPAPEPRATLAPPVATKQVKAPKKETRGSTTSGSDWAEVDNIDNWEVHPESSDY